jgi:hypothetical protein
MVTPRQLQVSKCGYETSLSTGNYATIFAHPRAITTKYLYLCTAAHLFIYLYGNQNTAVSTTTRHWAGQPRIKFQCLAVAGALPQSTQTSSGLWTCPASYSMGIRAPSSGEKMSEHEADHSPPPLPTLPPPPRAELYHNPRHAFMACRHSFTPYSCHTFIPELESGNRAGTYTQVSAKCHKHITHSSFLCT